MVQTFSSYQVDAFVTDAAFSGNPAAVVSLQEWLPDDVLLKIAQEHNQSETAFFIPLENAPQDYELRWFTPEYEVDLCGHATLASASVIFNELNHGNSPLVFKTRQKGDLFVNRKRDGFEMDFPTETLRPAVADGPLKQVMRFPFEPVEVLRSARDWHFVLQSAEQVLAVKPDFNALAQRRDCWVCVSAPGDNCDFVSRFFTPDSAVQEDPVTGSTHTSLIPYWSARLGKKEMMARQLSARGGILNVRSDGARVRISGNTRFYSKGTIYIPG